MRKIYTKKYYYLICFLIIPIIINGQSIRKDSLERAEVFVSSGMIDDALPILNNLIKFNENNYQALMYRTMAYYQLGLYDKALEDAISMIEDSQNLNEEQKYNANWNAAVSLIMQSNFKKSLDFILEANKLQPDSPKANQTLSLVYINLGEFNKARKMLKKLTKKYPFDHGNYKLMGQSYLMNKEYKEALPYYDKAIEINKFYAPSYENRATVKFYLGDKEGACKDLQAAFELGITHLEEIIKERCSE